MTITELYNIKNQYLRDDAARLIVLVILEQGRLHGIDRYSFDRLVNALSGHSVDEVISKLES